MSKPRHTLVVEKPATLRGHTLTPREYYGTGEKLMTEEEKEVRNLKSKVEDLNIVIGRLSELHVDVVLEQYDNSRLIAVHSITKSLL